MVHEGYESKYEKTVDKGDVRKTLCVYKVENGYIAKVQKIPYKKEGEYKGMMDYENESVKYYISEEDPWEYLEKQMEEKEGKDSGSEGKSAAEAVKNAF